MRLLMLSLPAVMLTLALSNSKVFAEDATVTRPLENTPDQSTVRSDDRTDRPNRPVDSVQQNQGNKVVQHDADTRNMERNPAAQPSEVKFGQRSGVAHPPETPTDAINDDKTIGTRPVVKPNEVKFGEQTQPAHPPEPPTDNK